MITIKEYKNEIISELNKYKGKISKANIELIAESIATYVLSSNDYNDVLDGYSKMITLLSTMKNTGYLIKTLTLDWYKNIYSTILTMIHCSKSNYIMSYCYTEEGEHCFELYDTTYSVSYYIIGFENIINTLVSSFRVSEILKSNVDIGELYCDKRVMFTISHTVNRVEGINFVYKTVEDKLSFSLLELSALQSIITGNLSIISVLEESDLVNINRLIKRYSDLCKIKENDSKILSSIKRKSINAVELAEGSKLDTGLLDEILHSPDYDVVDKCDGDIDDEGYGLV